jgi:nicotinamide phosphoribosyltransferase
MLCKEVILDGLNKTSDDPNGEISFKLHDFGARGASSHESAGMGGLAHIVNFSGSDTIEGILFGMKYYDAPVSAYGIPASEHSTITSWLKSGEEEAYKNMVDQFAKEGAIFACVSDSYNIYDATRLWATSGLISQVKDKGATVVIRPDSGNPMQVPIDVIKILMEEVGYTVNSKGYKVLPSHVRVIQGDGITRESLQVLVKNMIDAGLSLSNLAFGMGGGLLQHVNRDDLKFAQKCSAAKVNNEWRDVYKDPVDSPDKKSLKGRMTVIYNPSTKEYRNYVIHDNVYATPDGFIPAMVEVYNNGIIKENMLTLEQVRSNAVR